jgi:hypothetical protein
MSRLLALTLVASAAVVAGCGGGGSESSTTVGFNRSSRLEEAREVDHQETERAELRKAEQEGQKARKKAAEKKAQERLEAEPPGADPIATEEFHFFSGKDLGNWEIAYGICAVTPEKQLAREFHTELNWAAIGHAYGSEYREPFNVAVEEGCMVALKDSKAEREAAFKMMEAAEG